MPARRRFELSFSILLLTATIATGAMIATSANATPPPSSSLTEASSLVANLEASQRVLDEIDVALRHADVRDAKHQVFKDHPWARADVRSLALLDEALAMSDTAEAMRRVGEFLEVAAADGEASFIIELDRMKPERRARLARQLDCPPEGRDCVIETYRDHAAVLLAAELGRVRRARRHREVESYVDALRQDLRPSIKNRGRGLRRALTFPAYLPAKAWQKSHSAHEYEGPQWIDFGAYRVYSPLPDAAAHDELLARFAPILVQEVVDAEEHDPEIDKIGAFELVAGRKQPLPKVDTDRPTSYAYRDDLRLDGEEFQQLIYTFWYPEHARTRDFLDFEAGDVEGITLRVTLDHGGEPRLYETVYNCGCSHRVFVDRELEAAAAAEYGAPEESRPYSIQRHVEGKIDWVVPELVERVLGRRPMLFVRAGFHLPASVRYAPPESVAARPPSEETGYALAAYEELEHLPYGEDWASIFNKKGLVRGASRLESLALAPLGMMQAGQPRQRGTQLIHFDQADFDDPEIYDTYLRLPSLFFEREETQARAQVESASRSHGGSSP